MTTMKDVLKGIEAFMRAYIKESLARETDIIERMKLEEIRRGLKHTKKALAIDLNKIYLQFYKRDSPYTRGVLPRYSHPRRLITRKRTIELEEI